MKYTCLFILFFSYAANAQPDVFNISLYDSSKKILYVGVDNQLRLQNIDLTQGSIMITNGVLTTKTANDFIATVVVVGTTSTITFRKKNKIILSKEFTVDSLPRPKATLGNIYDSIISLGRILANPYVTVGCNCYYKLNMTVHSFKLQIIKSYGNEEEPSFSGGNKLTDEQTKQIKECSSGDKLLFTEIRSVGADDRTRKLQPFAIIIK